MLLRQFGLIHLFHCSCSGIHHFFHSTNCQVERKKNTTTFLCVKSTCSNFIFYLTSSVICTFSFFFLNYTSTSVYCQLFNLSTRELNRFQWIIIVQALCVMITFDKQTNKSSTVLFTATIRWPQKNFDCSGREQEGVVYKSYLAPKHLTRRLIFHRGARAPRASQTSGRGKNKALADQISRERTPKGSRTIRHIYMVSRLWHRKEPIIFAKTFFHCWKNYLQE